MFTSAIFNDINNDNRPDFIVGINNDRPKVFINRTKHKIDVIKFNYFSKKQNYFGTKVWLYFDNGFIQTYELSPSASYLSQSAPIIFFKKDLKKSKLEYIKIRWPDGGAEDFSYDNLSGVINKK